jgi:hypothetical protein
MSQEQAEKEDGGPKSLVHTITQAIVPGEFYNVREEITPKAGPKLMIGGSLVAYALTMVAFAMLVWEQSKVKITTTTIETEDISDDLWTCSMLNKVTEHLTAYSIAGSSRPSEGRFSLIGVSQSKKKCLENLASADPCSSENLYVIVPDQSAVTITKTTESYFAAAPHKRTIVSCAVDSVTSKAQSKLKKMLVYPDDKRSSHDDDEGPGDDAYSDDDDNKVFVDANYFNDDLDNEGEPTSQPTSSPTLSAKGVRGKENWKDVHYVVGDITERITCSSLNRKTGDLSSYSALVDATAGRVSMPKGIAKQNPVFDSDGNSYYPITDTNGAFALTRFPENKL